MKHKLLLLYSWLIRVLLYFYPDIPLFMRFRGWLYGLGLEKCGKNFQVCHSVIINGLDDLRVGDNVYFANGCQLISNGKIEIGDDVLFGPMVVISAGNHQFDGESYRNLPSNKKNVEIGKGCWIGSNVTIVGGGVVAERSVVAANSCVTAKMEQKSHCLYGGVPAKFIKELS